MINKEEITKNLIINSIKKIINFKKTIIKIILINNNKTQMIKKILSQIIIIHMKFQTIQKKLTKIFLKNPFKNQHQKLIIKRTQNHNNKIFKKPKFVLISFL